MKLNYVKGDLLDLFPRELDAIGHVCNCQGVMGSGIALAIKNKFPRAYNGYLTHHRMYGKIELGAISYDNLGRAGQKKFVFNLHAQDKYGTDGKRYLDYESFYVALQKMRAVCLHPHCIDHIKRVGFPMNMGCDRAGGSWKIVSAMIEEVFENTDIEVTIVSLT